jgi:hypothetical protein
VLKAILLSAAIAGGAASGGVVLLTSGPLRDQGSDPSAAETATPATSAAASASPTATTSATASPVATPATSPTAIQPGTLLKPDDQFDFAALPTPDTSDWTTYRGLAGTLSFKAPPNWEVDLREVADLSGKVIGDGAYVRKPDWRTKTVAHGMTDSGFLVLQISTQPFEVLSSPIGGEVLVRSLTVPNVSPTRGSSAPHEILVHQFGQNTQFPDSRGELALETPGFRVGDLYLNTFAAIHFDAMAEDVSIVRAIIESIEVEP